MRRMVLVGLVLVLVGCNLEAELPTSQSGPVVMVDEATASGGRYARLKFEGGANGSVQYDFAPNGNYQQYPQMIWVRTRCSIAGIRVVVRMDATAPVTWEIICPPGADPATWSWVTVTPVGSSQPATWDLSSGGTHSLTLTASGATAEIDKIWIGPIGSASPAGVGERGTNVKRITVQAESGTQTGSAWTQVPDYVPGTNTAMRANAAGPPAPDYQAGTLAFTVNAPVAGEYRLWARTTAIDDASNSFFVQANGVNLGQVTVANQGQLSVTPSADWRWTRLSNGFVPVTVNLLAGANQVRVQTFEAGVVLDKLLFTLGIHDLPDLASIQDPFADVHPAGGEFSLLTEGNEQYVAYYNTDRRVTVAHRRLSVGTWKKKVLTDARALFTKLGGFDTHNTLQLALDANGDLHVSGNMHVEPMSYWRTTTPGDVTSLKSPTDPSGPAPMPQAEPGNTTYPEFYNGTGDDLFFTYRGGTSGNGEVYINSYDVTSKTWSGVGPNGLVPGAPAQYFVGGCAANTNPAQIGHIKPLECPPLPNGQPDPALAQPEYAYNRMVFDGSKFHFAWNWRTWDAQNQTNVLSSHDISYVWSPNMMDWYLAGQQPGVDDPLVWPLEYEGAADPKVIEHLPPGTGDTVDPLDPLAVRLGGGLHNSLWNISFDAAGEPIITYSKFVYPGGNRVGEVDSIVARARFDGNAWDITDQPPSDGACEQDPTGGPLRRAVPEEGLVERDGTLSQRVRDCDNGFFWVNHQIDAGDLTATQRGYQPVDIVPSGLSELEGRSTNRAVCGDYTGAATGQTLAGYNTTLNKNMPVVTVKSRGEAAGGRRFFLRWSRVQSQSFARPDWCSGDPLKPTTLRIYEAAP